MVVVVDECVELTLELGAMVAGRLTGQAQMPVHSDTNGMGAQIPPRSPA